MRRSRAAYLYLDLKKCTPPLSDLQPVLLWTCCPWKRNVMHLRIPLLSFFFSLSPPPVIPPRTLPQHATVPRLCTGSSVRGAQRSNPGFLSQACTSIPLELTHAHARREKKNPKTKHEMSARRRGGHCAPTCGVTVRRAGDKQSVGPAVEWCVSGRHSTAAARSAPARLGSALSSLSCSCVLQCLPRDGDRPPPAGPCKS